MLKINRKNFDEWLRKQFKFQVYEIAFAGLFIGLWCISSLPVFNFNLGFMHVGVTYVWPILLGLTTKPALALLSTIIGDNLALLINGEGFSTWMIEYAVIYPAITVISLLFKHSIISRSNKAIWWCAVGIINAITFIGTLVTSIKRNGFVHKSSSTDGFFDMSSDKSKIIIWLMYFLVLIVLLALIFAYLYGNRVQSKFKINQEKVKLWISFYSLITLIIVVAVWAWGPFAQIRFLNAYVSRSTDYYSKYDLYLVPRILKTPISLALYLVIIIPVYSAYETIKKHVHNIENKW